MFKTSEFGQGLTELKLHAGGRFLIFMHFKRLPHSSVNQLARNGVHVEE